MLLFVPFFSFFKSRAVIYIYLDWTCLLSCVVQHPAVVLSFFICVCVRKNMRTVSDCCVSVTL
jgi:hypothetical protein